MKNEIKIIDKRMTPERIHGGDFIVATKDGHLNIFISLPKTFKFEFLNLNDGKVLTSGEVRNFPMHLEIAREVFEKNDFKILKIIFFKEARQKLQEIFFSCPVGIENWFLTGERLYKLTRIKNKTFSLSPLSTESEIEFIFNCEDITEILKTIEDETGLKGEILKKDQVKINYVIT